MGISIKHRLTSAVLFSLECESLKICVEAAVKQKADLGGAYLGGADFRGADLGGADFRGADLAAQLGQPNAWDAWTYVSKDGLQRVRVGCHDFTLAEGRAYWQGKDNRREVMAALDYAEAIGKLRGWKQE